MTALSSTARVALPAFTRDRMTWLAYLMLSFYAYLQSSLGPAMPFLGAELGLSYTVRALHLSAFALGMIIAGLTADRAAARFGRQVLFWGGSAGMALGALLLTAAHTPLLTISGALMMGVIGSYTLIMVQAVLADWHGANRALALTESNVIASVGSALVPLMVSGAAGIGFGWRVGVLVGVGFWLALVVGYRHEPPIPAASTKQHTHGPGASTSPLPMRFWHLWCVVLFGVSIEWSILFWGGEFLETSVGLDKVTASGLMSVFLGAMVLGRLAGSRMTRMFQTERLLLAAIGMVAVGFPLFWLGQSTVVNVIGLFLCGLGVANLFPLTLAAASASAPDQINKASARISLAAGLAILIAPQVLGTVGDRIGISAAFALVALLIVGALALTLYTHSASR